MSKTVRSSKLDLLVKVRYLNPLPPPPFPPKLLNVTTDINRLGEPSYLNHLAASTPLPMLVDSEMGMPLDLNAYHGIWDGNDQSINPVPDPDMVYHPLDAALMSSINATTFTNGADKMQSAAEVSWMRTSNLFTRKANARRREAAETHERIDHSVDASEAAQIMAINKSFSDLVDQDTATIRHPDSKKRALSVVESYDFLPDDSAWSTPYILVRFPERPSAATASNPSANASSSCLSKAVLRPLRDEDQQIMEFHLPSEENLDRLGAIYQSPLDDAAVRVVREMSPTNSQLDTALPNVEFDRIRTYEVVTQTEPAKEVLVSFDEGEDEHPHVSKRRKGVYYKDINMRTLLRKTRGKRAGETEAHLDLWDGVRVGFRLPTQEEEQARETVRRQINDPSWINQELRRLHGGENMAEGEGEAIDDEEVVDEGAQKMEDAVNDD